MKKREKLLLIDTSEGTIMIELDNEPNKARAELFINNELIEKLIVINEMKVILLYTASIAKNLRFS